MTVNNAVARSGLVLALALALPLHAADDDGVAADLAAMRSDAPQQQSAEPNNGYVDKKVERQQDRVESRTDQEIDQATDKAVDKGLNKIFDKLFGK